MTQRTDASALTLQRELYVPRELIFQAWTESEHLEGWYAPAPDCVPSASVDARPGGTYRLSWTNAAGAVFVQEGRFSEVARPAGFRCSLCFAGAFPEHFCTELEVRLVDLEGTTRIEITQTGFPSAALRERQRAGWQGFLDQLEGYFSRI
jgi:uncharacterized protein YndB with AHSA1/START domain